MARVSPLARFVSRLCLLLAAGCALPCCASAPRPAAGNPKTAPLWVAHPNEAYPNSEWLCVVDRAYDKESAEAAAMTSLAQVFRVDLNSVTNASRQFAREVGNANGKKVSISSDGRDFAQELVSSSAVYGLVGVRTETWAAPDGTVYANARMNRRECAARYSAMLRENEKIIRQMKGEAAQNPATFEAAAMLNFAASVAQAADNFQSLLSVLDPSAAASRPDYGNAEAVKGMALEAARSIVVAVSVSGDADGRLAKAFSGCLTARGFRTDTAAAAPYTLAAAFELADVDTGNPNNKFVRYVLSASLKNSGGVAVLSHSENSREGHLTQAEARQRAIRAAEASIGAGGFAARLDAYLASLLQ